MKYTLKSVRTIAATLITFGSLAGGANAAAVVYSPTSVIRNDFGEYSSTYQIESTINQDALSPGSNFVSGTTDYATYIASSPTHQGNNGSGLAWFGINNAPTAGFIDFDLGSNFTIESLAFFSNPKRGFTTITVFTANEPTFSLSANVGNFAPFVNGDGATSAPVQDIDLTDSVARYVRFSIDDGYSTTIPSMGEVAFGVSSIPEPSSALLLGLGALSIAAIRRRNH